MLILSRSWTMKMSAPDTVSESLSCWAQVPSVEAVPVYGCLSPYSPSWDSLTRAQQVYAQPRVASVMLSYSNPSLLHFLCCDLQLMSLVFSFLLPVLSTWMEGFCVVLLLALPSVSPHAIQLDPQKWAAACKAPWRLQPQVLQGAKMHWKTKIQPSHG